MRIVVIDDQAVFREGLKTVLSSELGLEVVGEAGDARTGFSVVDRTSPDLVVVELVLPGMDGIAAVREVRRRCPTAQALMVSAHADGRDVAGALAAGALGYVLKSDPVPELLDAVRTVGRGERFVSPSIRSYTPTARVPLDLVADVLQSLSTREREVFDLVIRGFRNREIARELCISIKTVDSHRTRINEKLACASTVDLVLFAARHGLLRLPHGSSDLANAVPHR